MLQVQWASLASLRLLQSRGVAMLPAVLLRPGIHPTEENTTKKINKELLAWRAPEIATHTTQQWSLPAGRFFWKRPGIPPLPAHLHRPLVLQRVTATVLLQLQLGRCRHISFSVAMEVCRFLQSLSNCCALSTFLCPSRMCRRQNWGPLCRVWPSRC